MGRLYCHALPRPCIVMACRKVNGARLSRSVSGRQITPPPPWPAPLLNLGVSGPRVAARGSLAPSCADE